MPMYKNLEDGKIVTKKMQSGVKRQNASFANLIILRRFGPQCWKQQATKVNIGANQSYETREKLSTIKNKFVIFFQF